jgi:hypothetical protein
MPELGAIFGSLLTSVIQAVESSEKQHLQNGLDALKGVTGKTAPGLDDLAKALQSGWLPDYFIGAEIQVNAQLTMTTVRGQSADVKVGTGLGPITISGGFSESFRQGTNTNLSVTCTLTRQSRTKAIENAFQALSAAPASPVTVPTGTAGTDDKP